jgi:hypothetical protein
MDEAQNNMIDGFLVASISLTNLLMMIPSTLEIISWIIVSMLGVTQVLKHAVDIYYNVKEKQKQKNLTNNVESK